LIFSHPLLASVYDPLDPDRSDLDFYAAVVAEFGARRVLDVGCGTGSFAVLLAVRGIDVTGVDPAAASLDVARRKPGAERVRWLHGDAGELPAMTVDLATMTGNVAQAIVDPGDWDATLAGIGTALQPGGHLVFETRDPARRAWLGWNRADTRRVVDLPEVGRVATWTDLLDVAWPLVTFQTTWVFSGETLTSTSTLRFRERDEVTTSLSDHGYTLVDVRDAPDRPGREFVFVARWGS
jgi:SAM-dependent methyltransferase